jgi:hypothetical protein
MRTLLIACTLLLVGCKEEYRFHFADWVTVTGGLFKGQEGQIIGKCHGYLFDTKYLVKITGLVYGECISEDHLKETQFKQPNG